MTDAVVRVENVTKRFSGHTAVRDLSLEVPRGVIFGLLGPNGAGKSTTIRMMMDIIEPDEGRVTLFGGPGTGRELSARIGFLPEERGLYPRMEVLEQIIFLGETKGLRRTEARERALRWLDRLGLGDWAKRKVQELSKGMQQKVQFIGTLLHDPDLVILDEPFSGLDPVNLQVMKDVVVEIARSGRTVLFSTHIMEQAEKMCDRILLVMAKRAGRWIAGAINFLGTDAVYGRNWGAIEHHPFLHFELCYYQAIDYAIAHGLARVEAGAQGPHKLARGYQPIATRSAHHIADPAFARAVADYLVRERRAVGEDQLYLGERTPFRRSSED